MGRKGFDADAERNSIGALKQDQGAFLLATCPVLGNPDSLFSAVVARAGVGIADVERYRALVAETGLELVPSQIVRDKRKPPAARRLASSSR